APPPSRGRRPRTPAAPSPAKGQAPAETLSSFRFPFLSRLVFPRQSLLLALHVLHPGVVRQQRLLRKETGGLRHAPDHLFLVHNRVAAEHKRNGRLPRGPALVCQAGPHKG